MKKTTAFLVALFVAFPGYGDKLDDAYHEGLDAIQESMKTSASDGYDTALPFALGCVRYIHGFVDGNRVNGNTREFKSNRYIEFEKERKELSKKMIHSLKVEDMTTASYYAKKSFELACGYERNLIGEMNAE